MQQLTARHLGGNASRFAPAACGASSVNGTGERCCPHCCQGFSPTCDQPGGNLEADHLWDLVTLAILLHN
jgi:hypothetical protein